MSTKLWKGGGRTTFHLREQDLSLSPFLSSYHLHHNYRNHYHDQDVVRKSQCKSQPGVISGHLCPPVPFFLALFSPRQTAYDPLLQFRAGSNTHTTPTPPPSSFQTDGLRKLSEILKILAKTWRCTQSRKTFKILRKGEP